jgi:hypothetical protein
VQSRVTIRSPSCDEDPTTNGIRRNIQMLKIKEIAATLAILGSGALAVSACNKDKQTTENPDGAAAEGGDPAAGDGDAAAPEGEGDAAAPEGDAAAEGEKAEGSCGGEAGCGGEKKEGGG